MKAEDRNRRIVAITLAIRKLQEEKQRLLHEAQERAGRKSVA